MKIKLLLFSSMLILMPLLFASCNNDDDDDMPPADPSMSAQVDGTAWEADETLLASNNQGILTVTGTGNGGLVMQIRIENFNGIGTYTLGAGMNSLGSWKAGNDPSDFYTTQLGGTGTVEVTSANGSQVVATFTFTANGTTGAVNVTNGEFTADI